MLREIGYCAFEGCTALKAVDLSVVDEGHSNDAPRESLKIGPGAFSRCSGLERIEFPYSMRTDGGDAIGHGAFAHCDSLKFFNVGALALLYLPNSGRGVFRRTDGGSLMEELEGATSLTAALSMLRFDETELDRLGTERAARETARAENESPEPDIRHPLDVPNIYSIVDSHLHQRPRRHYEDRAPPAPGAAPGPSPKRARFSSRFASHV